MFISHYHYHSHNLSLSSIIVSLSCQPNNVQSAIIRVSWIITQNICLDFQCIVKLMLLSIFSICTGLWSRINPIFEFRLQTLEAKSCHKNHKNFFQSNFHSLVQMMSLIKYASCRSFSLDLWKRAVMQSRPEYQDRVLTWRCIFSSLTLGLVFETMTNGLEVSRTAALEARGESLLVAGKSDSGKEKGKDREDCKQMMKLWSKCFLAAFNPFSHIG